MNIKMKRENNKRFILIILNIIKDKEFRILYLNNDYKLVTKLIKNSIATHKSQLYFFIEI